MLSNGMRYGQNRPRTQALLVHDKEATLLTDTASRVNSTFCSLTMVSYISREYECPPGQHLHD